jgi:hypothetical protein
MLWAVCLALFPGFLLAQAPVYVNVPTGNVAALSQAIVQANDLPDEQTTVILLEGNFSFSGSLPPIEGTITIRGQSGAGIFQGKGLAGPDQLLFVSADAKLTLTNIEFKDFSLDQSGTGLIENLGHLDMRKVQLSSVSSNQFCRTHGCSPVMAALTNRSSGFVQMNQVSFVDSGGTSPVSTGSALIVNEGGMVMVNVQMYLPAKGWETPLSNSGSMTIASSSFKYAGSASSAPLNLIDVRGTGSAEFANSVFAGFAGEWCQQAVSRGYNLNDAPDCEWSETGDLGGVPAGLLWRPVEARWSTGFGPETLTNALVPLAASAAVDSAGAAYCPSISLLNDNRVLTDGNGDGQAGCDRGAVELTPIGLAEGGINGLYFDPEADGHYLYILQNDFNTLVVWNTFDPDGHPVWVYGTGELQNGRSLIANTYINRNGRVSLNGDIEPAQDEHWGSLEIDMTSCTNGTVGFDSDLPEFGSGQFSIQRLAYVKQLGCTNL